MEVVTTQLVIKPYQMTSNRPRRADPWELTEQRRFLAQLTARYSELQQADAELTATLEELVPLVAAHGTFNFMLSNGVVLCAHCSTKLHSVTRRHPFASARLQDEDLSVDFARNTAPTDRVAVVVTEPLTVDEPWLAFAPGELRVFEGGSPVAL